MGKLWLPGTFSDLSGEEPHELHQMNQVLRDIAEELNSTTIIAQTNIPVGMIWAYAGATAPSDSWLLCRGQAVSRTTYSDLFDVISTTYGVGDGSTTFNVPDMAGKVPVGLDTGDADFDALNEQRGAKTHTLSLAETPAHQHGAGTAVSCKAESGYIVRQQDVTTGTLTTAAGGGGVHNNIQPSIVINYIIRV